MTLAATPAPVKAPSLARSESQPQRELSPLEGAPPNVRAVFDQVLDWHRLTPLDRHRGKRGAAFDYLCYAGARDLDTAQAFLRQGYCTRDAATALHRTIQARFEEGAVPEKPLAPIRKVFGDPYTWTDRHQKRGAYVTWKRCRLLAAIQEKPGAGADELARMAGMSTKRGREALGAMLAMNKVLRQKEGHRHLWTLTKEGKGYIEKARQRLSGTFTSCCESTPDEPGERTRLSLLFEAAQTVSRELRQLGWYPDTIRDVFKKHNVSYILGLLRNEKLRSGARSFGALLNAILLKQAVLQPHRLSGLAKTLSAVSEAVRQAFQGVATQWKMRFDEARHLACSIRKVQEKRGGVGVGDVHGIASWIMKRKPWVPIRP